MLKITLQELEPLGSEKKRKKWSAIEALEFNPNGSILAFGSANCMVGLMNINDFGLLGKIDCIDFNFSINFNQNGSLLAIADGKSEAILWDVNNKEFLSEIKDKFTFKHFLGLKNRDIVSIAFNPDGKLLTSVCGGNLIMWEVSSGKLMNTLTMPKWFEPCVVKFSPDGKVLASGGVKNNYGSISLWNVSNWELLPALEKHGECVLCLAFSPDSKLLASGCLSSDDSFIGKGNATIKLWQVSTGKLMHTLELDDDIEGISSVAFSPGGHFLAATYFEKSIKIWEVSSGRLLHTLDTTRQSNCVAFSPKGNLMASGHSHGTISLWEVKTTEE